MDKQTLPKQTQEYPNFKLRGSWGKKLIKLIALLLVIASLWYVVYDLGLKPYISNMANYGYRFCQIDILTEVTQCKTTLIPLNESINVEVVAVRCLQGAGAWKQ